MFMCMYSMCGQCTRSISTYLCVCVCVFEGTYVRTCLHNIRTIRMYVCMYSTYEHTYIQRCKVNLHVLQMQFMYCAQ